MPVVKTKGAASSQGFGEFSQSSGPATYIEDVFSTYLYTGNGSTQTINNGIDLAGKGGLVWCKDRDAANYHTLYDTARGISKTLYSNATGSQVTEATNEGVYSFGANGFSIGGASGQSNGVGNKEVSWTFRKQPKFFDVVTWTGDGTSNRLISHNLNSVPGCVIVKCTSTARSWVVAARADVSTYRYLVLNDRGAQVGSNSISTYATSTTFNLTAFTNGGSPLDNVNGNGNTYVAYLFAHNAGGFGPNGTDNVISCGSFTTDASGNASVTLGWEPQWLLHKCSSSAEDWYTYDSMRGLTVDSSVAYLRPNLSNAEGTSTAGLKVNSTGFNAVGVNASSTYIYIAIRRPMKVPTSGTQVYNATTYTGSNTISVVATAGFPIDAMISYSRSGTLSNAPRWFDRLRGDKILQSSGTGVDNSIGATDITYSMTGATYLSGTVNNWVTTQHLNHFFKRASGFMDVVCYKGTGVAHWENHGLQTAPELLIIKSRTAANTYWLVQVPLLDVATYPADNFLYLNTSGAVSAYSGYFGWKPTSTQFRVNSAQDQINQLGQTYVAYLFASCPGVSKVGSYTGNGSSQTINCGFSAGARFILIKRTDSTGDWYVWDTARGIVTGNDPRLSLNTTASEVTTDDSVGADATGFIVNQLTATNVNVSGGTYIYLAIA